MEKSKFKKLLFNIACSTMACDFDIDEREIEEIKDLADKTTYFDGLNLGNSLDLFVKKFKDNPHNTLDESINSLNEEDMDPVQEMLILEVVLRVVYADTKVDPKEVEFVKKVRSVLAIEDNVILSLQKMEGISSNIQGQIKCYVTDDPSLFNNVASRFCMKKPEQAVRIDL